MSPPGRPVALTQALARLMRESLAISAARVGLSLFIPLGIAALGAAGAQQQAAFGLAASINNWFLVVGPAILLSGFFKGAEAARRGQGMDRDLLQSVLSLCAIVAALALVTAIVLAVLMRQVYPDATGRLASQVLLVQSLSNVFYFYLTGVMLLLEGLGRSRVVVAIILGSLALNAAANQLLLQPHWHWDAPALVASWSLLLARMLGGAAVLWYVSSHVLPLRLRDVCFGGSRSTIGSLLRIGSANGAGKAAEAAAFSGLGALAAALGAATMAAYAIFYSFISLIYMYLIGITNATCRSWAPAGADTGPRFDLLRACLAVFAGLALVTTALALGDAQLIWGWASPGAPVSALLAPVTLPAVAGAFSFAAVFLASQLCRAIGLHRLASLVLMLTYPVLMLGLAWVTTQWLAWGLPGLVGSFVAANVCGLLMLSALAWRHMSDRPALTAVQAR